MANALKTSAASLQLQAHKEFLFSKLKFSPFSAKIPVIKTHRTDTF